MSPYYDNNGITLYHGECRHVLPALVQSGLQVDAIITDPPYSSGGLMRSDRMQNVADKYCQHGDAQGRPLFSGDNRDQRSWIAWASIWLEECRQVLRPGGYVLVFTDWRMLPATTDAVQGGGLVWRGVVAWDKGEGSRAPHKGYFRHQCEYVVWGTNGECAAVEHDGPWAGCIKQPVRHDEKLHVTGKPEALMRELCRVVPEGSLIFDPFAGSGTTLRAARDMARRAIGIEQEEKYCQIAAERMRQEVLFA